MAKKKSINKGKVLIYILIGNMALMLCLWLVLVADYAVKLNYDAGDYCKDNGWTDSIGKKGSWSEFYCWEDLNTIEHQNRNYSESIRFVDIP